MLSISYLRTLVDQIQAEYPDLAIEALPAGVRRALDQLFAQIEKYEADHEPALAPSSSQDTFPGTDDRLQVMADRFAAGLAIFHPDDARALDADRIGLEVETLKNGREDRSFHRSTGYVRHDYIGQLAAAPPAEEHHEHCLSSGRGDVPVDRGTGVRRAGQGHQGTRPARKNLASPRPGH